MSTPGLWLVSIVAVAAYLALAVLGMGGLDAFLAHPALIALAVVTLLMLAAAMFTSANLSSGEREDRGNRWVLVAFGVLGLLSGWLPAFTDRKEFLTIDGETVRWIGVALYAAGGALRLWPVFVLGRRFSGLVAIQPGHQLVTSGLYSMIRNPSYLGMIILGVGWALAFRSLVGVALAVLMIVPLVARIRSEEALLSSQFGAQYDDYRARTWRLLPGVY
jgi:protein-S-isoprenylcysteine O-methyltransferase Ste14